MKTNLGKFAFMHLSEKGPKGRFFASDKLDNHTIEGKGKNKQIERAKRKKGGGKKKAMVAPIVLTFSTLEIVFWQKKMLGGRGLFGRNVFKNAVW